MQAANPVDVAPVERVLALRTFAAFEGLSPSELAVMAEQVRPRLFRADALLQRPGLPARALHFVVHGRIDLIEDGQVRRSIGPHGVFGGLASLTTEPVSYRAVAGVDTVTLELSRDDMEEVFEDNFPIFFGVLRVMARMLVASRRKLGDGAGRLPTECLLSPGELSDLGLVERILVLRRSMDFAGEEIETLAELAQEAEDVDLPSGRTLWKVGDAADHAIVLIDGAIRCKSDEGHRFSFGPGAVVGSIDALCGDARWYAAVTDGRVRALRVRAQALLDAIEDNMAVGMNLLRVIARGIREIAERISLTEAERPIA